MNNTNIISYDHSRQEDFGSPKAVLMGTNGVAVITPHRQRIFDFQGK